MDFAAAMPLAGTLGVTIEEGSKERIAGKLPVRPEICPAGGIVHGGAIMAFADCLGAGPVGSILVGEATPVKVGKRLSVWQTRIRTEEGAEVALVTQTQMVLWPA